MKIAMTQMIIFVTCTAWVHLGRCWQFKDVTKKKLCDIYKKNIPLIIFSSKWITHLRKLVFNISGKEEKKTTKTAIQYF